MTIFQVRNVLYPQLQTAIIADCTLCCPIYQHASFPPASLCATSLLTWWKHHLAKLHSNTSIKTISSPTLPDRHYWFMENTKKWGRREGGGWGSFKSHSGPCSQRSWNYREWSISFFQTIQYGSSISTGLTMEARDWEWVVYDVDIGLGIGVCGVCVWSVRHETHQGGYYERSSRIPLWGSPGAHGVGSGCLCHVYMSNSLL